MSKGEKVHMDTTIMYLSDFKEDDFAGEKIGYLKSSIGEIQSICLVQQEMENIEILPIVLGLYVVILVLFCFAIFVLVSHC